MKKILTVLSILSGILYNYANASTDALWQAGTMLYSNSEVINTYIPLAQDIPLDQIDQIRTVANNIFLITYASNNEHFSISDIAPDHGELIVKNLIDGGLATILLEEIVLVVN